MSDIADRAGVAKGTVFRHFASKEDLVSAVVAGLVNELVEQAEGLLDATDPLQALREFVAAGIRLQARDQAFCQLASTAELAIPGLTERRMRLENVADLLARRAVEAGAVRADVTGRVVVGMMTAAYQGACATGDPGRWPYFLSLLVTGLRHADDSPPLVTETRRHGQGVNHLRLNAAQRLLKASRRSSLRVGAPITRSSARSRRSSYPMSASRRSSHLLSM